MPTTKATELQDHLSASVDSLIHDIEANKKAVATKLAAPAAASPAVGLLDPANVNLAAGAENVGGTVVKGAADLVTGVAGTAADVVGGVGTVADSLHTEINSLFSGIRKKLGI